MFVRCRIQFAEHPDTTVIPVSALVRRNGSQGVFLVDSDKMLAKFVPAETGITEGEWVEILQPKLEGQVVTIGQHLLEDGAKIMLPEDESGQKDKSSPAQSAGSKAKGAGEGTR